MFSVKYLSTSCPQMLYVLIFTVLLILEVSSQTVYLEPFNPAGSDTICDDGSVINGRDRIIFNGTVDARGFSSSRRFSFYKNTTVDPFMSLDCVVDVDRDGCPGYLDFPCYCQVNNSGIYKVVYNRTADETEYGDTLRLIFSSARNETKMPVIRKSENATLTINGSNPIELSSVESQQLKELVVYEFEICATNLQEPWFYIGNDSTLPFLRGTGSCLSFTVITDGNTLYFSYHEATGCVRNVTFIYDFTRVLLLVDGDACDWRCIIYIVIGIVLAVALGASVWYLIWQCYPDEWMICCCKKTSICCCKRESVCCCKKTPGLCCVMISIKSPGKGNVVGTADNTDL